MISTRSESKRPAYGRRSAAALVLGWAVALAFPVPTRAIEPVDPRFDYLGMFELTRGVMTRKGARQLLNELFKNQLRVNPKLAAKHGFTAEKLRGFTETQFMLLLQEAPEIRPEIEAYLKAVPPDVKKKKAVRGERPVEESEALKKLREKWRERFRKLFGNNEALLEKFLARNNPLEPFVLEMPSGKKGFGRLETYLTYGIERNGKYRPPDDGVRAIVDFIDGTRPKGKLRFNVFDFDNPEIAEALVRAKKRGVEVMGGIDKGVVEVRPEVKAVYDRLTAAGIPITAVDSVGLNHQKLIVRDWDVPGEGAVLMSTGNFTNSCLAPNGDLAGTKYADLEGAIPNANMIKIARSDELAAVVHHELTKTIDPLYALKGEEYPLSGAYRILGDDLAKGKARWMTIAFTPNGGLENVNKNFIGRVIRDHAGPSYTAQFAWSAMQNEEDLYQDALAAIEARKKNPKAPKFSLTAVGDTPFAMQDWSVALAIAGYRLEGEGDARVYVPIPDEENRWLKLLGREDYDGLLANLRIAPRRFGGRSIQTPDGPYKVTSKVHLKIWVKGVPGDQIGIFGSFNFSAGAESNQEYIVAIADDETNEIMQASVEALAKQSPRSVADEAVRRNRAKEIDPPAGREVEATKAYRSPENVRLRCNKNLTKPTVGTGVK